jgi:alanine racemase
VSEHALREARIDLGAISSNVRAIRAATGVDVMVVVKANGYGHGAVQSARAALEGGATWLGVADIAEALELRAAGIDAPVLAWLHDENSDFAGAIAAGVDIGVSHSAQLEQVAAASGVASAGVASAGVATVQFKVDTGLSRNGLSRSEWETVFSRAAELERAGKIRVRGIFSHLANAGQAEDRAQTIAFAAAREIASASGLTPELVHLASTGGALRVPAARFGMVRVGIGAYGLTPFEDGSTLEVQIRPAMQLSAGIVSVKRVPAGSGVSYGFSYRTTAETTLALVPLGYADGIPRLASNTGPVAINGTIYRVSGRVAMDQFVIDVGDDSVAIGDRAVLFGDPATGVPSADDWASAAKTINYEIVTRIGPRVVKIFSK